MLLLQKVPDIDTIEDYRNAKETYKEKDLKKPSKYSMKILIIGIGSIGQRHLVNMMMLDKKFICINIKPIKQRIVKNNNKTIIKNIYDYYGERLIYLKNKKDIQEFGPDAVLICNFSNKHITAALPYLKDNIHVFVEKPLATSQSDLLKLKKLSVKLGLSMVGFQERFNPCIKFVKKH